MRRLPAGNAAALLATALLLGSLAGCCRAVEQAKGTGDVAINAASAQAAPPQRAAAAAGAAAGDEGLDDSVRCRLSGICEGPPAGCDEEAAGSERDREDARLACLSADAERAAAVQEAARHAWGGYRCAGGFLQASRLGAAASMNLLPGMPAAASAARPMFVCAGHSVQGLRLGAGRAAAHQVSTLSRRRMTSWQRPRVLPTPWCRPPCCPAQLHTHAHRGLCCLAATPCLLAGVARCLHPTPVARHPRSCTGGHWLNLSLTMVDSLDTLYLLGMRREFEEAARWVLPPPLLCMLCLLGTPVRPPPPLSCALCSRGAPSELLHQTARSLSPWPQVAGGPSGCGCSSGGQPV